MAEVDGESHRGLLEAIEKLATGDDPEAAAADIRDAYGEAAASWVDSALSELPSILAENRADLAAFETRLIARWASGLDILEYLIAFCRDIGQGFAATHLASSTREPRPKTDALARLHAKGVLTGREGLALLRSGFATAAMARWRTLHETAVVAFVLSDHDDSLAERFLSHDQVESLKAQQDYERFWSRLNVDPPDWDPADRETLRAELVTRFGSAFLQDHGWAEPVFGHVPKLRELEEAAHLDHLRPYYRMASYGVHPSPKGVLWSLQSLGDLNALMAGPSNAGLADPGHSIAISLAQLTVALIVYEIQELTTDETELIKQIGTMISMLIALELSDRVGEALIATHQTLEEQEQQIAATADRLLPLYAANDIPDLDALAEEWELDLDLLVEAGDHLETRGLIRREVRFLPITPHETD